MCDAQSPVSTSSRIESASSSVLAVLLVDDDADELFLLRAAACRLSPSPEVTWARDAAAAYELTSDAAFDLILVDHHLGPSTGLDLVPRLRAACPHATIRLLTHRRDNALRRAAEAAGVDMFDKNDLDSATGSSVFAVLRPATNHLP